MTVATDQFVIRRDAYRFGRAAAPALQPGTFGWTARDLEDPLVRRLWDEGRYEIVDGVLTVMPPAYFMGGSVVDNLKFLLRNHFISQGTRAAFSGEVDIVIGPARVARADGVVVAGDDLAKFEALRFDAPDRNWRHYSLTLPPTIVIESVSQTHEAHDRVTKRQWYAQFRVPNYWIVDGFTRTLECLRLMGDAYVIEAAGSQDQVLSPPSFPGLTLPLRAVWEDSPGSTSPQNILS
jgi:Uma2 family endonuclease